MSLHPERIRAILFDIDGTLRDTDDELIAKLAGLARRPLGEPRATRWMRGLVMAVEGPTQVLLGLADRVSLDGPLNRLIDYASPHGATRAVPHVREVIGRLRGRYRLGVVSAGPARSVERFLTEHGLHDAMDVVVTGQTYRRTKPNPEPVLRAAADLGVPASAVLMVGDTTVDIKAGRRAGAQTLGVLTGFGRRSDLERERADQIADSVADLPALLGA